MPGYTLSICNFNLAYKLNTATILIGSEQCRLLVLQVDLKLLLYLNLWVLVLKLVLVLHQVQQHQHLVCSTDR